MNGFVGDLRFCAPLAPPHARVHASSRSSRCRSGLGMAAAAFSVIDTVLVEPLPFPRADRLVLVHATVPPDGRDTPGDHVSRRRRPRQGDADVFASMALVMTFAGTATALDPPERRRRLRRLGHAVRHARRSADARSRLHRRRRRAWPRQRRHPRLRILAAARRPRGRRSARPWSSTMCRRRSSG